MARTASCRSIAWVGSYKLYPVAYFRLSNAAPLPVIPVKFVTRIELVPFCGEKAESRPIQHLPMFGGIARLEGRRCTSIQQTLDRGCDGTCSRYVLAVVDG